MEEVIQQPAQRSRLQSYFLAAAFILFTASLVLGIFSGVSSGKDQATYKNLATISNALQFYYSDQDRYPSETQFNDQKILVPFYTSAVSKPVNAEGVCKNFDNFIYTQQAPSNFQIDFCLEQGVNGLSRGFHSLTEKVVR
jgi:type II secretory pathway pseudopilin PulG